MKALRISIAVALDKVADVVDALENLGVESITVGNGGTGGDEVAADDVETVDTPIARSVRRANAGSDDRGGRGGRARGTRKVAAGNGGRGFGGRPKLYTPNGSAIAVREALAKLASGSMSAVMLKTIAAKKNGVDKATLRKVATQAKLNPESVDNAVWTLQNRGLVKSIDAK